MMPMDANDQDTHLDRETLARLVDDELSDIEQGHLDRCTHCFHELESLGQQTRALGSFSTIEPGAGEWEELEARLLQEGLIGVALPNRGRAPGWFQAAAGLLLFLTGAASGSFVSGAWSGLGIEGEAESSDEGGVLGRLSADEELSLDDAEGLVRLTEELYFDALLVYRDRVDRTSPEPSGGDPISRFVALENVLAATEAAVWEAPGDPFFNGLLVSTTAEHRAAMEGMAVTTTGIW